MIKSITKASSFNLMKMMMFYGFVIYGLFITIAFIKVRPKPMVVWVTDGGTYLVIENTPELKKKERVNFVKKVLLYTYNFDETNFDDRMSTVGDMLSPETWEKKKPEWESVSIKTKTDPVTEKGSIRDLRQIDETHFEADLEISVNRRIKTDQLKIRANIEIAEKSRSENNPYPFEVVNYAETIN